jgi:hypothetical protein
MDVFVKLYMFRYVVDRLKTKTLTFFKIASNTNESGRFGPKRPSQGHGKPRAPRAALEGPGCPGNRQRSKYRSPLSPWLGRSPPGNVPGGPLPGRPAKPSRRGELGGCRRCQGARAGAEGAGQQQYPPAQWPGTWRQSCRKLLGRFPAMLGQTWSKTTSRSAGLVLQSRLNRKSDQQNNYKALSWCRKIKPDCLQVPRQALIRTSRLAVPRCVCLDEGKT